ncbi:hypothetical protein BH24BAC1_BH24BAC1_32750 [soil metagenome]
MKLSLSLLIGILLHHFAAGQSFFRAEYPAVWQRAAEYTLEVAAAMPADKYGFAPKNESMSFLGQMVHLVQNLSFLSGQITGTRPDFFIGENPQQISKEKATAGLRAAFQHVGGLIQTVDEKTLGEKIKFAGETMTKENIFYLMRDHLTHHRAQAILYLRLNGIAPPTYRGW